MIKNLTLLAMAILSLSACVSAPKFDAAKIRPWSNSINGEYPRDVPVIAHYKKGEYELFYVAARHTNQLADPTLKLVQTLFDKFQFNLLIIEPLPFSEGISPKWYVDQVRQGRTEKTIPMGESGLAVVLADDRKIPFVAGEPDDQDIYWALKEKGYTDEDILGFHTVRQMPQWVREGVDRKLIFSKEIPDFLKMYCKRFSTPQCMTTTELKTWYKQKLGHELVAEVSNEELAPFVDGKLFTQKISSHIAFVRDRFTLRVIEQMLEKYKKVAVVYGAGHFVTLRQSLDKALGEPSFTEGK